MASLMVVTIIAVQHLAIHAALHNLAVRNPAALLCSVARNPAVHNPAALNLAALNLAVVLVTIAVFG